MHAFPGAILLQLLFGRSPFMREKPGMIALQRIATLRGHAPVKQLAAELDKNFWSVVVDGLL